MANVLLFAILLSLIALIGCFFGVVLAIRRRMSQIEALFTDFITPKADNQPSPLATAVDAAAQMAARAIVAQAVTTLRGFQSGMSRAAKSDALAESQGGLEANPLGGLLMNILPKSLRRNPAVLDGALALLGRFSGGGPTGRVQDGTNGDRPPKFKL